MNPDMKLELQRTSLLNKILQASNCKHLSSCFDATGQFVATLSANRGGAGDLSQKGANHSEPTSNEIQQRQRQQQQHHHHHHHHQHHNIFEPNMSHDIVTAGRLPAKISSSTLTVILVSINKPTSSSCTPWHCRLQSYF